MAINGWHETTLGDFVTLQRGHDLPDSERRSGNVPVIGSSGITGYHDTALAKGPGVTVGRSGASFGVVTYSPVDYWPHNACLYTINFHGNDERFAYYYLKSMDFSSFNSGSAQPSLNRNFIHPIKVEIPAPSEQRAIAGILGALDDKIEVNHRMNATLESMARAVFRQWFVENEDIGNWKISQIGEIADVIDCLHSKKPERQEVGKPFLQLSNILDNGLLDTTDIYFITKEDYDFWISRIEASPGDCVVTNVGRVGAIAQIPEGFNAALGRNMTAIRCKKEYPYPTFLIECLMSDATRQEINNKTDSGTILDALNVKNIPLLQFVLPPHNLLQKFEEQIRPIRAKMEANLKESRTLGSLRDSLLPKLMRGEIRVKDL